MFLGDASTLLSVLNRRLPELGLVRYVCTETSWIESVLFWTDIRVGTSEIVLLQSNITVNYIKRKSDYVHEPISRTGLESIWRKMIELEILAMAFNPYEGMMAKISPTATPFPYRADNLWKIQCMPNSISWVTTCMEEMRQDIARMQTQRAAEATTPASIDINLPTSIDADPSQSNPMNSQPDSYARAEIDQMVEEIYRILGAAEERLDKRCDDIYFPWDITISSFTSQTEAMQREIVEI
ncbi:PREDICTED: reticuline oxidase-like protein [Brassica oleracea var. oleracea]|uniref:reticuline oxidase-like protein n=1 Tax=Brassica oleracea var. oleracea TaxID=109376 RepID=UPI0006A717B8|nr:PREDICTED: reticuline oxidase-like protein [Brassica oleracea var. oleracea]